MVHNTIFTPSFGNRPHQLVGRDLLLQEILDGFETLPGSKERARVILGQRGSGKTVLLREIADRASASGLVVTTPTVTSEDMPTRIIEKLQDTGEAVLKLKKHHVTGGNVGVMGFSVGLQFTPEVQETKTFEYKLIQLTRKINEQGKGVLILLDELQANSPEIRRLITAYDEMVGERLDVSLVMAGLPGAVSATLNDKVLTFLNRAKKTKLEDLPFSDVDSYYKEAFKQAGLIIENEQRRFVSKSVEGSPYLLQLIGYNLVKYTSEDGVVSEDIIQEALKTSSEEFEEDVCKTTLAALSDQDSAFLKAMVQVGLPAKVSDIAEVMGVTTDYAQKYRKRLIDSGTIMSSRRGYVEFDIPFLESYLKDQEI